MSSSSSEVEFASPERPAPDADPPEYIPESVLEHRVRGGAIQYFVKWVGYSDSENTWEDEADLTEHGGADLIVAYMKRNVPTAAELKKKSRNRPFQIVRGFQHSGKVYYRVRFENGTECDFESAEMQEMHQMQLVEFLEHVSNVKTL
jgi:hypothetical protein